MDSLRAAYGDYELVLEKISPYREERKVVPGEFEEELELARRFERYRAMFIEENWFYSNLLVPFHVYNELSVHSNLNLYIFQKTFRGTIAMEILRSLSALVHFLIFILFPIAVAFNLSKKLILAIGLPVLLYLAYLIFIQRGVEERYTAPVIIPMLIVVASCFLKIDHSLKKQ